MNFKFVSIIALMTMVLIGKISSAQKSSKTFNYISFTTLVMEDNEVVSHEYEIQLSDGLKKTGMESVTEGIKMTQSFKGKPLELLNDLGLIGFELISISDNHENHKRTYFLKKETTKAESPGWDPKTVH